MALLASYMVRKKEKENLQDYLANRVFAESESVILTPKEEDIEGFEVFIERYKKGIAIERSALEHLA